MTAASLTPASPAYNSAVINSIDALIGASLTAGAPDLIAESPALIESYILAAGALTVASPGLGAPSFPTTGALPSALPLTTGSPEFELGVFALGAPVLGQVYNLSALPLSAPPIIGSPALGGSAVQIGTPIAVSIRLPDTIRVKLAA